MTLRAALVCLLLASTSPLALAGEATPDGAKHLTDVFQSYLGKVPGVVSVVPAGDAYTLTLDFAPLFARSPRKDMTAALTPLVMKLADQGGGKWLVTQDQPVNVSISVPEALDLKVNVQQYKSSGIFDEAIASFESSTSDVTGMTLDETVHEAGQMTSVAYAIQSMHNEIKSSAAASGVDTVVHSTGSGLSEVMQIPSGPGGPPVGITLNAQSFVQDVEGKGFMMKPILDLLAFAIEHPDPEYAKANQAEIKTLLTAALPVFNSLNGTFSMKQLTVMTPIGPVKIAEAGGTVAMNGIISDGLFGESIKVTGLELPPGIVPPFAASLTPKALTFDFKVSDFNLDAPARMIIDKMDLSKDKPLSPEMDQQLLQALLPKGAVTMTLNPSLIESDAATLSGEGAMTAGPMQPPAGSALVKLKGFDAIMQAIQSAPPEMGLQQGVAMLIAAKGMAKPEGDLLTWKVESTPNGRVTINGIDPGKM